MTNPRERSDEPNLLTYLKSRDWNATKSYTELYDTPFLMVRFSGLKDFEGFLGSVATYEIDLILAEGRDEELDDTAPALANRLRDDIWYSNMYLLDFIEDLALYEDIRNMEGRMMWTIRFHVDRVSP